MSDGVNHQLSIRITQGYSIHQSPSGAAGQSVVYSDKHAHRQETSFNYSASSPYSFCAEKEKEVSSNTRIIAASMI